MLLAALSLGALKRHEGLSAVWLLGAAGGLGAGATAAFKTSELVRSFLRMGVIAPPLVVSLFLFFSPASGIVFAGEAQAVQDLRVGDPAPVVVVLFDEFPAASLMTEGGEVDAELFPNFARLADDATWFRWARGVHAQTESAIPSILSGTYPEEGRIGVAADYPRNLFTLLGGAYDVTAVEPITALCPSDVCTDGSSNGEKDRFSSLLMDTGVAYLHLLLPEPAAQSLLPPIDDRWAGMTPARQAIRGDHLAQFAGFVASLGNEQERATLHVIHALLPHSPWQYLPSKQSYEREERAVPGRRKIHGTWTWGADEWLLTQAHQRHLLQVGLVDTLLGELIETLKASGRYDESLLVVAADHGIALQSQVPLRSATSETLAEVASVPLFVKRPFQKAGGVVDDPVQVVDILPTIVDVLGVETLWELEGTSLFAERSGVEQPHRFVNPDGNVITLDRDDADPMKALERKLRRFPATGPHKLFRVGPHGDLVGKDSSALKHGGPATLSVRLVDREWYRDVQRDGPLIPAQLWAQILGPERLEQPVELAVAVNGRIAAVTRTFVRKGAPWFTAMLVPEFLRDGDNRLEVYLVETHQGERVLRPVQVEGDRSSVGTVSWSASARGRRATATINS
jgi:hypothetical protein